MADDTAFHATNPELTQRFALPAELHDAGVRRYGLPLPGSANERRP